MTAITSAAPRPALGDARMFPDSFTISPPILQDTLVPAAPVAGTFPGWYFVPTGQFLLVQAVNLIHPFDPVTVPGGSSITFTIQRTRGATTVTLASVVMTATSATGVPVTLAVDPVGDFLAAGDRIDVTVAFAGVPTIGRYGFQLDVLRAETPA
jgi:hypothetical protein